MVTLARYPLCFVCTFGIGVPQLFAGQAEESNLKLVNLAFEPIAQGKNVVRIKLRNPTQRAQTFAIHIQTQSPKYGARGMGWGTPFFDTVSPGETKWSRFVFKIQGPVTERTSVHLRFYNPESVESYDFKQFFEERRYTGPDVVPREVTQGTPVSASDDEARAVTSAFAKLQDYIRHEHYQEAWNWFTEDYRAGEFWNEFEHFINSMEGNYPDYLWWWDKTEFLALRPRSVTRHGELLSLSATNNDQTWKLDFSQIDGRWRVDWISGYVPALVKAPGPGAWEGLTLPKMHKRRTEHFDIYYFTGSTAEKEADLIAEAKERGYAAICKFLGQESDVRIRLILFEDQKTKFLKTGHQGMGWAYGQTIVEVYNQKDRLDPNHETTHVLMGPHGNPPALLIEGFAVYMSERLGAPALEHLGGGTASIYERVRNLKGSGEWIGLEELLTNTEIGSEASRSHVSYAEAGAFVKFLIDRFGKDKFLEVYKSLQNSDDPRVHRQNRTALERVYGHSLQNLEESWQKIFTEPD